MIEADNITMRYGPVVAVEDATFRVRPGEVVGLLGPNGAGKSTIMKVLTTYLYPTSGAARVCGKDILADPIGVRRCIGYLPEVLPLYTDMEVGKYIEFVARARGLAGPKLAERIDWVVERCGVRPVFRTLVRELSKGFRQRAALAQALVHDPAVVILDEPTSGLDPHQIVEIRRLVRELAKEKTVICSTHILQEVEAIADRIVVLSRGRVVADGTFQELRRKAMKRQRVEVAVAAGREEAKRALGGLADAKDIRPVKSGEGTARFCVEADFKSAILGQIDGLMHEKGWQVTELVDRPFTLEETFLALTEAEDAETLAGGAA